MKTVVLDNLISEKELFFMYNEIINTPNWRVNNASTEQRGFLTGPILIVKKTDTSMVEHYPFLIWGQVLVLRIAKLLEEKKIGIPTELNRMWFNTTYNGKKTQHWLHNDGHKDEETKSIVVFMTPVWQPDWRGSFYIDGEEHKYKPGSAIIFDSKEFHRGESPESETYNWQRMVCNILVK